MEVGKSYGSLRVLRELPAAGPRRFWLCACDCGTAEVRVRQDQLKSGHTRSCGCLRAVAGARNGTASATHGRTGTPEYVVWVAMWQRCVNPKHRSYKKYQDRTPPSRWKTFEVFYADMGPRPGPEFTIERVRNSEPYGPGNCVWLLAAAQARNTSKNVNITFEGRTMCAAAWAKETGISTGTICHRHHAGWTPAKILNKLRSDDHDNSPTAG